MPPIPVYANAPLHPQGVTPKTAAPDEAQPGPIPSKTTAIPTAASQLDPSLPPPPQPGARPQPPAAPTSSSNPPAPQPGAVPSSITATHTTTETYRQGPPPQFAIPAPSSNQAPTRSTTVPQPSPFETGRSSLDGGRTSFENPPGYVQNPYAADGTAADRARLEAAALGANEDGSVIGNMKSYLGGVGEGLKKAEEGAWRWAKGEK